MQITKYFNNSISFVSSEVVTCTESFNSKTEKLSETKKRNF